MFKKSALAVSLSLALVGCGGGSSSSSTSAATTEVSGTAEAPGGVIAQFEKESVFEIALNFVFEPAAAALSGLQPIQGATVELIRVDANGDQVGDVLATTATSITGDYTLTLPAGVDLSGDLIVRITGTNSKELRAQVVEQDVDINPVSEYILQRFVDNGTDLTALETSAVVQISNKVEAFDLVAGGSADIDAVLAQLENELGDFVDNQISSVTQPVASNDTLAAIAGDYRSTLLTVGLHDDDQQYGVGTFATDLTNTDFTLANGGNSVIDFTLNGEEQAWSNFMANNGYTLTYVAEIDQETETFTSTLRENGVASIEGDFEEDIDGDFGFRFPPTTYNLQKVSDKNIFALASAEAAVRYRTIDTNEDNVKDAVDPQQREGDEIMRSIELFAKKPSGMSDADLRGDFGRVYMGIQADTSGSLIVETEHSTMSFDGAGSVDIGEADYQGLDRIADESSTYSSNTSSADAGLSVTVSADGDITSIGGQDSDGYVNDTYDLVVFGESDGVNNSSSEFAKTISVKLPTSQLDISNKQYRVQILQVGMSSGSLALTSFGFNSVLSMNNATTGTFSGTESYVEKAGTLTAEVTVERNTLSQTATVSVGANGFTTITIPNNDSAQVFKGWLNDTGSMGVFATYYQDGQADPDALGLAILTEITE
ncbi:MAG: hypothetical protein MK096_02815 [Oleiphilaceae bacterium]|nr:hypothetical protein [Oleiphilaceae bacterium]